MVSRFKLKIVTTVMPLMSITLLFQGDFGKVIIGGENAVADQVTVSAPKFLGWKTVMTIISRLGKIHLAQKTLSLGNEDLSKDQRNCLTTRRK